MVKLTDPARELTELCDALNVTPDRAGSQVLSDAFGVPAWSTEFYQIVFTIGQRFDVLYVLIDKLDMDEDIRARAHHNLTTMKLAFTPSGLNNAWSHTLNKYLSPKYMDPIRMLSPQVRALQSYPKVSNEEVDELAHTLEALLSWLRDHQLSDQDFIRQALIEGLERLQFRLSHIRWLGWGYTLESLRDVVSAYMALERASGSSDQRPDAEVVLKKTAAFVNGILEKVQIAKDITEKGDFILRAYGAVTLFAQGHQQVAGLLTNLSAG